MYRRNPTPRDRLSVGKKRGDRLRATTLRSGSCSGADKAHGDGQRRRSMNDPADHRATLLRERLDRLASSLPVSNGMGGAQLYRRSLRRRRRRVATSTALVATATALVIVGGATWVDGWLAFAGTVIIHANSPQSPGERHVTVDAARPAGDALLVDRRRIRARGRVRRPRRSRALGTGETRWRVRG